MKTFLLKLLLILVVSAALAGALVLTKPAAGAGYTLADAVKDVAWRKAAAERLKQLATEDDARRVSDQ